MNLYPIFDRTKCAQMSSVLGSAIYNGLYLLGFPIQWQLIATALVLLAAVTVDSLSRRGAALASAGHA